MEVALDGERGEEFVFVNWNLLKRANFTDAQNGYTSLTVAIIQS